MVSKYAANRGYALNKGYNLSHAIQAAWQQCYDLVDFASFCVLL